MVTTGWLNSLSLQALEARAALESFNASISAAVYQDGYADCKVSSILANRHPILQGITRCDVGCLPSTALHMALHAILLSLLVYTHARTIMYLLPVERVCLIASSISMPTLDRRCFPHAELVFHCLTISSLRTSTSCFTLAGMHYICCSTLQPHLRTVSPLLSGR